MGATRKEGRDRRQWKGRAKSSPANLFAGRVRGRVAGYENPGGFFSVAMPRGKGPAGNRTGGLAGVCTSVRAAHAGSSSSRAPPVGGGERMNLDLIHIAWSPGDSLYLSDCQAVTISPSTWVTGHCSSPKQQRIMVSSFSQAHPTTPYFLSPHKAWFLTPQPGLSRPLPLPWPRPACPLRLRTWKSSGPPPPSRPRP